MGQNSQSPEALFPIFRGAAVSAEREAWHITDKETLRSFR